MTSSQTMTFVLSILGVVLANFSATYTAHPDAGWLAYAAAISGAVGSYLLGKFQNKPGA